MKENPVIKEIESKMPEEINLIRRIADVLSGLSSKEVTIDAKNVLGYDRKKNLLCEGTGLFVRDGNSILYELHKDKESNDILVSGPNVSDYRVHCLINKMLKRFLETPYGGVKSNRIEIPSEHQYGVEQT